MRQSLAQALALVSVGVAMLHGCGAAPESEQRAQTAFAAQAAATADLKVLLASYAALSWKTDGDQKAALLDQIAKTGADQAVSVVLREFEKTSWRTAADVKMRLLDALDTLCVAPADESTSAIAAQSVSLHHGPSLGSLLDMQKTLEGDLSAAPSDARGKEQQIIHRVSIIAPTSTR